MSQSATLPTPGRCSHRDEEKHSLPASCALLTRNLEDLHLAEGIERALRATGYGALRTIEVAVHARIVRLVGRVPSYYLKQVAQVTALAIPETQQVRNDLDVA